MYHHDLDFWIVTNWYPSNRFTGLINLKNKVSSSLADWYIDVRTYLREATRYLIGEIPSIDSFPAIYSYQVLYTSNLFFLHG